MNITVIGAAGSVGRRVVAEALARDHRVRAVVRSLSRATEVPAGAEVLVGDAGRSEDVARLSAGQDVVVSAVALLDEAERPRHHRMRFTVGY